MHDINSIPKPRQNPQSPPFDRELSSKLDLAHQQEAVVCTAAIDAFIQWKRHLQQASNARAVRREVERLIWRDGGER